MGFTGLRAASQCTAAILLSIELPPMEKGGIMQSQERLARQLMSVAAFVATLFIAMLAGTSLLVATAPTASAALPSSLADDADVLPHDVSGDRWQRFLRASRGRYQALAEKAEMVDWPLFDDCVDVELSLADRRECLRADVFARVAMERDGMALDEYASVLHLLISGGKPVSAAQRGQFQRLRAEWWPERHTAEQ
jgi:hypothetical protein